MNSTALITGASSGIGEELAKVLAANDFDLVLVARTEKKLRSLADELTRSHGRNLTVIVKDLSDQTAADQIYRATEGNGKAIDVLVNNAGLGAYGPFHSTDWSRTRQMIEVNMMALTHLTRLFLPAMLKRGHGRILNIASTAAFQPGPLMSVYYATKAYVLHFTEGIAAELDGTGVTVTAYCPGPVQTNFQNAATIPASRRVARRTPWSAEDVARDAFRAMMEGRTVRIPGIANYLLSLAPRFGSRAMVRKAMRYIQSQRNSPPGL